MDGSKGTASREEYTMSQPRNATTGRDGRTYRWRGETFTSVTTVINGGVPKPQLKAWGERLVAETAWRRRAIWGDMTEHDAVDWLKRAPFREMDRARVRGSHIHDWAERWALGQAPRLEDVPEGHRGHLRSFLQFVEDWHPQWEMSEASVYSRRWGYAGTLDALMRVDGLDGLALVDYKTGKSGVFPEVALQLAAYRYAEFVGLHDGTELPIPAVDWCAVLWLGPTRYELVPVDASDVALRYFLYAKYVRHFCVEAGRTFLGVPLEPPSREKGRTTMQLPDRGAAIEHLGEGMA
jgi:hypothetical protein